MNKFVHYATAMLLACFTHVPTALADRQGKFEFTVQVPYLLGETIDFSGGAEAEINDDPGFGFGFGYNLSNRIALRGNLSWNTVGYDAVRVLDNAARTELSVGGDLDTFSSSVAGEFYFTEGSISPYVTASVGWTTIDSNIAAGPPQTVCWWDPWWGYICDTGQSTYYENYWHYGLGVGVRFDVGRANFIRVAYQERWLDVDDASGTPSLGTALFEFGFSY